MEGGRREDESDVVCGERRVEGLEGGGERADTVEESGVGEAEAGVRVDKECGGGEGGGSGGGGGVEEGCGVGGNGEGRGWRRKRDGGAKAAVNPGLCAVAAFWVDTAAAAAAAVE